MIRMNESNREDRAHEAVRAVMGPEAYARLSEADRKLLALARWSIRPAAKGTTLIEQGQERSAAVVFLSGWAFRYHSLAGGKRQILDFLSPGTLVGFGPGATIPYGAEAVTTCTIASLPLRSFYRLLSACPALAIAVAEGAAGCELRAHEHMTHLGRRTARERVAALIVELASTAQLRAAVARREALELPITQCMIGDALGLSNEHVCRTLAKLSEDGVLAFNRHTLRVLDPEGLAAEAGLEMTGRGGRKAPAPSASPAATTAAKAAAYVS